MLWSSAGKVMPRGHGRRLANLLPNGTLVEVDDAYVLSMLDGDRLREIIEAEKPDYILFDCWEKYANVVAPKDEQNAADIIAIAAKNGGEKTTPNLR